MRFPWNNKAILWVDDKPNNNKKLMQKLAKNGIMCIPRVSTHDAMQFIKYMERIFLHNSDFNKFRIISDMTRYEKDINDNGPVQRNGNAGAVLVKHLREKGYNHKVCIYTSNAERAKQECKNFGHEDNIEATTSTSVCEKFANY